MEEDRSWSVTLTGKTQTGSDPQAVWQRAASMMKFEPDAFRERVLDRAPLTLKAVSQSDACRQRDALLDCGADAVALNNPTGRYLWLQLDGTVHGPVSEAFALHSIDDGSLDPQARGCIKGEHAWQPLAEILGLPPLSTDTDDIPAVASFEPKRTSAAYIDMPEAAMPVETDPRMGVEPPFTHDFSHPLPENVPSVYGGFWLRVAAEFIDIGITWILTVAILLVIVLAHLLPAALTPAGVGKPLTPVSFGLLLLIPALYFALFESSAKQATPGKMALGLMVTDGNARRIGFLRALWRYLARWFSSLVFGIGFMMAGWTRQKRALHDYLAGTFVIRKVGLESWRQGDGAGSATATMPAWAVVLILFFGGLFLAVPVLAAIAIPSYQGYVLRSQVMEATAVTQDARQAVAQYMLTRDVVPADNAQAGLGIPDQMHGHYVSSVEVSHGTVVASFGGQSAPMLQNKRLVFAPLRTNQHIIWTCSASGIPQDIVSAACRNP